LGFYKIKPREKQLHNKTENAMMFKVFNWAAAADTSIGAR
jgi:hypothetical protein